MTTHQTPHRLSTVFRRVEEGLPLQQSPWPKRVKRGAAALALVSGLLALGLIVQFVLNERDTLDRARNGARSSARRQAAQIDERLRAIQPIATSIAADMSAGKLTPEQLQVRFRDELTKNPDVFEVGIVYMPYAKDKSTRLYAPQIARQASGFESFRLDEKYDYTGYPWYKGAIAAAKPYWGEPYFGLGTHNLIVGYTVPFYEPGNPSHMLGVVRTNLSMDGIRRIVSGLSLGQTGYGFLLSRKGVFISDPVDDYVKQQKTIFDIADAAHDTERRRLGEQAIQGKAAEANSFSGVTGQATWIFAQPIPTTGWTLGATFLRDEFLPEPKDVRRSLARIGIVVMFFLFFSAILWFRGYNGGPRVLWNVATTQTVLLVGGIAFMWWLTLHYPDHNGETAVHIADQSQLQKFLETRAALQPQKLIPQQIPTGLYVRTLRFGTGNDVVVTGSLWQKYPVDSAGKSTSEQLKQGFRLIDAEAQDQTETYRARQGDVEVVGWDFKATVRERFEGAIKYPFDRALIRLRVAAAEVDENVILTPDLYSYQLLTPSVLPGVERSMVLPGWDLISSYFNYSPTAYNTSFGLPDVMSQDRSYELGYTIVAGRRFLDPFIASVLPIIVVSCLLFGLLLVGSRESTKVAATGFKATDVLRAGITLLFPVLVAQVNLRSKIGSNTIIYIEYFYFVMYAAILGVAANALQFTLGRYNIVHVRDNLIPKLIYWPFVVGACFVVTLIFLY